jgi:hypothetical protein
MLRYAVVFYYGPRSEFRYDYADLATARKVFDMHVAEVKQLMTHHPTEGAKSIELFKGDECLDEWRRDDDSM